MKKITVLLCALALSTMAFSQPFSTSCKNLNAKLGIHNDIKGVPDTLWEYADRATGFVYYKADHGSVCPDNIYTDESGMQYTYVPTGTVKVSEMLVWFAKKIKIGSADSHTATVYNCGADSLPTAPLGTQSYTTDDVDSSLSGTFTSIVFSTAPIITGNFVVSISGLTGSNDDTTWVVSNKTGDGLGEGRFMTHALPTYGGVWYKGKDFWVGWDNDMMIVPVLDITAGIDNGSVKNNGLTLYGSYPNPASSVSTIKYELSQPSTVTIKVFDVKGRVVSLNTQDMPQGIHTYNLNVNDIASGNYYYTVSTKIGTLTSKISVNK